MVDVIGKVDSDNPSCPLGSEVRILAFWIFHLSRSGVWGAKGEDFAGGGANGDSSFLEYHSVDGGIERRALNIVFELVLAAFGSASESAPTDLGLGSPRGNPRVAPSSDNTGSDGRGGGFGKGDGLFELVMENGSSFNGFGGIGEESIDPGADDNGEIFSEKNILEPFQSSGLSRAPFH